jgi:signal transduction histidine kinase
MRLTIFQKGLLLVSVPLAFELAFVSYLSSLLNSADQEIQREQHAKDVILHADTLRRDWTEAAFSATCYAYTKNPVLWFKYKTLLNEIDEEMGTMRKLCANNPLQRDVLEKIDRCNANSTQLLADIQTKRDPLTSLFPIAQLAASHHPFVIFRTHCDTIVDQEQSILDKSPAIRREQRKQIEQAMWGAIGFNVALTIFFTAYLARNITGRLQSVMINTRKMVKRQELLPEVGGSDEIAELDRTIHRTSEELAELEKFKRELTAMVTHELRTPLTSIQGVLTLLRVGALGEIPTLAQDKVQMAEANSQRLIRLINDLLDIEKMEAGKLEITPQANALAPIIDQSIGAVSDFAAQSNITIESDPCQAWVMADSERLVQVVINFLSNAIKYSEKGSVVTVSTRVEANSVELRVTDCGRGIPEDYRQKIFEKFEQVNAQDPRDRKGTGLGLAICKGIIEQHHGNIGVESEVGKGSSFWFTIPIAEEPRLESVSTSAPANVSRT